MNWYAIIDDCLSIMISSPCIRWAAEPFWDTMVMKNMTAHGHHRSLILRWVWFQVFIFIYMVGIVIGWSQQFIEADGAVHFENELHTSAYLYYKCMYFITLDKTTALNLTIAWVEADRHEKPNFLNLICKCCMAWKCICTRIPNNQMLVLCILLSIS